jgi:hypothetical protein
LFEVGQFRFQGGYFVFEGLFVGGDVIDCLSEGGKFVELVAQFFVDFGVTLFDFIPFFSQVFSLL